MLTVISNPMAQKKRQLQTSSEPVLSPPRTRTPDGARAWLETWKAIADYLGRSPSWCRSMVFDADPLPTYHFGGRVRADKAELDAWMERRRRGR
jgi:hypothetical protein